MENKLPSKEILCNNRLDMESGRSVKLLKSKIRVARDGPQFPMVDGRTETEVSKSPNSCKSVKEPISGGI